MKLAIAGAGVAGAYLGCMLNKKGHQVEVFEWSKKENYWPVCAWAGPRDILSKFSEQAGLNFDEYILYVGEELKFQYSTAKTRQISILGLVTFNKQKWQQDLLKDINVNYDYRCSRNSFPFEKYDYVIDCTGVNRELLPKPNEDFLIPSFQYLVENVSNVDKFYISNYGNANGYFWYFPLGSGRGFVGAGDIDRRYKGVEEFLMQHQEITNVKKVGRPIRVCPPNRMEPLFWRNVIGVGESIGCVFPLTGEGIAPALICSDILLDVLDKSTDNMLDLMKYAENVKKAFDYYEDVYKILKLTTNGRVSYISEKIEDLKRILPNSPLMSKLIKNVERKMEFISIVTELAKKSGFPIYSYHDLIKLANTEKIRINGESIAMYTLDREVPEGFFPIWNEEDFKEKANNMFDN